VTRLPHHHEGNQHPCSEENQVLQPVVWKSTQALRLFGSEYVRGLVEHTIISAAPALPFDGLHQQPHPMLERLTVHTMCGAQSCGLCVHNYGTFVPTHRHTGYTR
jgi:hypothetical protein